MCACVHVNIRNRFGSGPLHLAAYRGYPNIVKFLLDRGANPNVQTSTDREVPLHHAALMGHADVAKLLVEAGADTAMQSFYDVTPLICASAAGEHSVVDALLQSTTPPVSLKEHATAMLLLGAAYVDRHQNRAKAEQIWSQAMTIEGGMTFAHGQLPKYRIYDDIQFPESRAKLKHTLADDWQGFNLASAIREHVLGPSSQDTIHYLRCRGAMEADARRYVKAMKLWLHCLRLEMDSGKKGTTPGVTSTLTACTELLVEQIRNEGDADVKALFEVVWSNLHRHPLGGIECGKTVRILLTVLYVWDKLSSTMPHHFVACREAAQRFVYQRFVLHKGYNNYTPLHLVCDKKTFVSGAKSRKNFCQFPSPPLLKLLLESGADQIIEERDSRGNTPLHTAAASGNVGCVREMLFYLTAKQATLTNHSGVTAASISSHNTPSDKIHMVINEFVSRCK
ncbi:protein fem-1 homolog C-like [Sycon ciliatum]|uniref:protein fem-1 homolog C-like n=1 Tax=Sycon ciliatum TaxID=27933 RepID=UPI0031F66CD6